MAPYPHLLSPLRIAGHTLPNRMVMGAMHTRLETLDNPLQRLAAFYARRAQGEISLILTGGYSPTPEGVMDEGQAPGGLDAPEPVRPTSRTVHLFQRTPGSPGKHLGKSTGWILKAKLRKAGVRMVSGVHYTAIDDRGLHYTLNGEPCTLNADTLILCTGQEPENSLLAPLRAAGYTPHLIGGAERAGELDALRAIDQATRLAHTL